MMQANKMFPTYVFAKVQRYRLPHVIEQLRKLRTTVEQIAQTEGNWRSETPLVRRDPSFAYEPYFKA